MIRDAFSVSLDAIRTMSSKFWFSFKSYPLHKDFRSLEIDNGFKFCNKQTNPAILLERHIGETMQYPAWLSLQVLSKNVP